MSTPAKPKQAPHRPPKPGAQTTQTPAKKAPYGDVAYADPGYQADKKKRYPVDTPEHARAAWDYINKESNASAYSSGDLAKVKSSIKAAAAKQGVKIADNDADDEKSVTTETPAMDAAHEGTSTAVKNPDDAARKGTSSGHAEHEIRKVEPKVKTLEELRARLAEIAVRMEDIGEETRDAEMDAETEAEWDALEAENTKVRASIKKIEARMETLKGLANDSRSTERGNGAPAFHASRDLWDVEGLRASATSQDDYRDRLRENALRAVDKVRLSGAAASKREDVQEHVEHLLNDVDYEKGILAARMLATGSPEYERAFGKMVKAGTTGILSPQEHSLVLRAQQLSVDADGGYAVPFQLDPSVILTSAGVLNPLRQMARIETITGKEWQGVTSAGTSVTRAAEAAEVGDGSFTLAQPVVRAERVQGFVPFTVEIDADWGQLRSEITRMLTDAREREESDSFVNGNGTSPNAHGVLATLSGNTVTGGTALSVDDLYAVEEALDQRWLANAQWLASRSVYNKVRQFNGSGDGNNALVWARLAEATANGSRVRYEVLGYPANISTAMPAYSVATGTKDVALFGDFQQFLIVDRVGMNVELVPQIFGSNGRPTGQRGVYAYWRNNSKILVDAAFKRLQVTNP